MPLIRRKTQASLNGYVQSPAILENIDTYIVPPALGGRAGVLGAIALAQQRNESLIDASSIASTTYDFILFIPGEFFHDYPISFDREAMRTLDRLLPRLEIGPG